MRKKHPEHVNLERWLVSYADFITLLFAFFVIMYSLARSDMDQFSKVAKGIRNAFGAGPAGMVDMGGASGGRTVNPFESIDTPAGRVLNLPAGKTNTASDPDLELQEIRELLEETVSLELGATDTSETLQMQFDSRGLVVRVAAKDFFDEGKVEARPDLIPILDRVGRVISKTKRLMRIEGHTDLNELRPVKYANDWELSAARAGWVAQYWIKRFGMDPSLLGVAGYSHFRPLSLKKDPWNRAKNRRVEIILLNNQYSK